MDSGYPTNVLDLYTLLFTHFNVKQTSGLIRGIHVKILSNQISSYCISWLHLY